MRKTLSSLIIAGLLFSGCSQYNLTRDQLVSKIDKERVFKKGDFGKYCISAVAQGEDIIAAYSLNTNGTPDLGADFEITKISADSNGVHIETKENATIVLIYNGTNEIEYSDTKGNGILDKKEIIDNDNNLELDNNPKYQISI